MKCKKSLIFALLIICLFSIAAVSASDVDGEKSSNIQLGNDTVEGVVATESSFNANTDVVASNEDDSSDAVSSEDNGQDILSWGDEHSFAELQDLINQANEDDEISLDHDYSLAVGGSTIEIKKILTINGNGHTLDGAGLNRIFDITISLASTNEQANLLQPVILKNIKFVNGGKRDYSNQYSNYNGGAITHTSSNNEELILMNCTFNNNGASNDGGAVYWKGPLTIIDSQFMGNTVDRGNGGAVFAENILTINNTRFISNKVKDGYILADMLFEWLPAEVCDALFYFHPIGGYKAMNIPPSGGAVFCYQNMDVENSYFSGNTVGEANQIGTAGGAIHGLGDITVRNSDFFSNKAYDELGGAIICEKNCNIYDSTFTDNVANCGGAVASLKSLNVYNSEFSNNYHEAGSTWTESISLETLIGYIPVVGDIFSIISDSFGIAGINFDFLCLSSQSKGGALYSEGFCTIDGCTFNNNKITEYGGAVYSNDGARVRNSKFTGNTVLRGDNVVFEYLEYQGKNRDSGAIHAQRTLEIINSNFVRNSAPYEGGAVYAASDCWVYDSNFEYNSAGEHGGAISANGIGTVSNTNFNSNYVTNALSSDGGAIYIGERCSPSIVNCVFVRNNALKDGGAIFVDSKDTTLSVSGTRFTENVAQIDGGAFYCRGKTNIYSSKFENNVANGENALARSYGGAVNSRGDIYVENSEFNSNQARKNGGKGGAIYAYEGARVSIKGSWFKYNTAEDGGAIYADKIHDEIYNTVFIGNKATDGDGGAIYINSQSWPKIVKCTFEDNTATDEGGAIYVWSDSEVKIVDSKFYRNSAEIGGATYVYKIVEFSNNIFDGNKAKKGDGGAIYADIINCDIYHSMFRHNQATEDGGAIYTDSESWPKIIGSTFEENTAGRYGGGIYTWRGSSQVKIVDSTFLRNSAKEGGGAYISKFTDVLNTLFKENKATGGDGGGLYANDELQNPNMQYTTFESNTAANRGGGLYIDPFSSTLGLLRCTFYNNAAGQGGGAYVQHVTEIMECSFIGNRATATKGDGGGIYINRASDFEMKYNRFENNHAKNRGGGIYIDSKTTHIIEMQFCSFVRNQADRYDYHGSTYYYGPGHSIFNSGYYPEYFGACWFGSNSPNFSGQLVEYHESANDQDRSPGNYYLKVGVKVNEQTVYYVGDAYVVTLYFIAPEGYPAFSNSDPFYHSAGGFYPSDDINYASFTMTRTTMGNVEAILVPKSSNLRVIHAYIDDADVSVGITVQDKTPSTVKIVSCENVQYPDALKVTYNINPMSSSSYTIKDSEGEIVKTGELTDPNTVYIKGLAPGSYSITISNFETWTHSPKSDTKTFNIEKGDVNELSVAVCNSTYPDDVKCIVYASVDGEYNLTVNNATYSVTVENGAGYINIGTLNKGTYDAVVSVAEIDIYNPYSNATTFVIYPSGTGTNFAIDLNATEIDCLQTALITHALPEDAAGNIKYYLSNGTILGELPVNENFILPVLGGGHYLIFANYTGDEKYDGAIDCVELTINKFDSGFNATIVNETGDVNPLVEYNKNPIVENVFSDNATGTIRYYLPDDTLLGETPLCKNYTLPILTPGVYYVTAEYSGDKYFNPASAKFTIYVYRTSDFKITADNPSIEYGQDIIIKNCQGTSNSGVNSGVRYYLRDDTSANDEGILLGEVIPWVREFVISGLDAGEHSIFAVCFDYNGIRTTDHENIVISKVNSEFSLNISSNEIEYGETPTIATEAPGCSGNVSYYLSDGTFLGESPVNENFTLPVLDVGDYTIIANYSGDKNHFGETILILLTVSKAQPAFEVSANENETVYGATNFMTSSLPENATGTISYYLSNGILLGESLVNETFTLPILNVGSYVIICKYSGDDNFYDATANTTLIVNIVKTEIFVDILNTTYQNGDDLVVTVKDINGNPAANILVYIDLNGVKNRVTDKNGQIKLSTDDLDVQTYDVSIIFKGTKNYVNSSAATTVVINKMPTKIIADMLNTTYMSNENLLITLKDSNGKPVAGVNVTVDLNGTKKYTTDENGQIKVPTYGLKVKTYDVAIIFSGTSNYLESANATTVTISNYQYLGLNVMDDMNNPIGNAEALITINGVAYKSVTDINGYARLVLVIDDKDKESNSSSDKDNKGDSPVKPKVITKATPKIIAKKKTFKKAKKVKKYTVTLKVNGKALAKKQLTLKIKGKTYKAKTNAKGNAVFKIKKLSKKGKFKATVTFKGDNLYNKVTKKVQIVIK